MSYADITAQTHIARQLRQHHHRNISNTSDEFVDASSQILSFEQPITNDRRASTVQKYQGKTMEELHLENTVLRKTTNDITKRLQAFESAAQTSSAALAQSIRSLHLSPTVTPQNSRGKQLPIVAGGEVEKDMRIKELEGLLQRSDKRILKRDEEIAKYQKKWQELKAGAKARRDAAGSAAGNAGADKARRTSREVVPTNGSAATARHTSQGGDAKDETYLQL